MQYFAVGEAQKRGFSALRGVLGLALMAVLTLCSYGQECRGSGRYADVDKRSDRVSVEIRYRFRR